MLLKYRNKEIPVQFLVTKLALLGSRAASGAAAQALALPSISLMPVVCFGVLGIVFLPLAKQLIKL